MTFAYLTVLVLLALQSLTTSTTGRNRGRTRRFWATKDWLDVLMPMDYQKQTMVLRQNETQFQDVMSQAERLITGLGLYYREGWQILDRPVWLVEEQIGLVRSMGIRGYCLFADGNLYPKMAKALGSNLNRESAKPFFR